MNGMHTWRPRLDKSGQLDLQQSPGAPMSCFGTVHTHDAPPAGWNAAPEKKTDLLSNMDTGKRREA